MCSFAAAMNKILKVHSVNDYARYIGAPILHPLVSVIHYDELEHCRHSLNNYDVYGIFIGDETLEELTYGLTTYDLHCHALMCVAPGQIGGIYARGTVPWLTRLFPSKTVHYGNVVHYKAVPLIAA